MRAIYFLVIAMLLNSSLAFGEVHGGYQGTEPNVELRISVDGLPFLGEREMEKMSFSTEKEGAEFIEANFISIKRGESVQLSVELIEADGSTTDVTHSPETWYRAVGKNDLKTDRSGLVTALPHKDLTTSASIFIIYNTPEKSGYNKVFFDVKQP